jgi:hypothetical protein
MYQDPPPSDVLAKIAAILAGSGSAAVKLGQIRWLLQ